MDLIDAHQQAWALRGEILEVDTPLVPGDLASLDRLDSALGLRSIARRTNPPRSAQGRARLIDALEALAVDLYEAADLGAPPRTLSLACRAEGLAATLHQS